MDEGLQEILSELRGLVERLDDLALASLREAVAAGEQARPALERRLTRARNGLVRVIALLDVE